MRSLLSLTAMVAARSCGVILALVVLGASAARADPKRVTLARVPVESTGEGGKAAVTLELRADQLLPADEAFAIELAAPPTGRRVAAMLQIWPKRFGTRSDCRGYRDAVQSRELVFVQTDGTFRAQVPSLQVGQPYCLRVIERLAIADDEATRIAARAATADPAVFQDLSDVAAFSRSLAALVAAALGPYVEEGKAGDAGRDVARTVTATFYASAALRDFSATVQQKDALRAEAADVRAKRGNRQPTPREKQADEYVEQRIEALEKRIPALREALTGELQRDVEPVVKALRLDYARSVEAKTSVESVTYVNFVSFDAGIALGFPMQSNTFRPQAVPYAGLNFYFTSVDRKIPVEDLVGSPRDLFLQRFSLTAGVVLSFPTVEGYRTSAALLQKPVFVAGGWRLTQYTRATAGVMFFNSTRDLPSENGKRLTLYPFVGFSADLDIVSMFRTGFGSL